MSETNGESRMDRVERTLEQMAKSAAERDAAWAEQRAGWAQERAAWAGFMEYMRQSSKSHDDQLGQLFEAQQAIDEKLAQAAAQTGANAVQIGQLVSQMMMFSEILRSHKNRLDDIDGKSDRA